MLKKFVWLTFVFAACFAFTSPAQADLVAYYPFDGNLNDATGNGKNGVFWSNDASTSTPSFVAGKDGQAISLQAFDSYEPNGISYGSRIYQGVVLPDESYFDLIDEISIACWIRFNSVMGAENKEGVQFQGNNAGIVTKDYKIAGASDPSAYRQYTLMSNWYPSSNFSRFSFRVQGVGWENSTYSVLPGTTNNPDALDWDTWYHVVVTWSSTDCVNSIYHNGQLNMSRDKANHVPLTSASGNPAVGIGCYATNLYKPDMDTTTSYRVNTIDGMIDDVGVFDRRLSDSEIADIYNNGSIGKTPAFALSIIESGGSTDVTEGGVAGPATDSYTVSLIKIPSGSDTVSVDAIYDANQITVSPDPIVLGNGTTEPNTRVVTVTVIDDSVPEGNHFDTIQHSMSSGDDPNFNFGVQSAWDVVVNITDNDFASVIVQSANPSDPFELWEDGPGAIGSEGKGYTSQPAESTELYTVKLGAPPSGTVTVTISSDDGEAYGAPGTLTFNTANWYTTQSVELRAVNDTTTFDGFIDTTNIEFWCSGGGFTDANDIIADADVFDGYYVENILGTSESDITEGVYVSNIGDGSAGPGIRIWGGYGNNEPDFNQPAFAAGWQGKFKIADANKMVKVSTRFSLGRGAGIEPNYVSLVVLLVDGVRYGEPGTIDPNASLLERNTSIANDIDWHDDVRYIPVLSNADPNHTVTLGTYTSGYYNTPGTGSKNTYTGLSLQNFKLEVLDTDGIGIMETPTARETSASPIVPATYSDEQTQSSDTYSVVLTKLPAGNVTVAVSPDPNTQVDKASLTFTTANWYVPQTVTVAAAENSAVGAIGAVTHSAGGYPSAVLNVTITDNDDRGVTIDPTTAEVSEGGITDTYTVVLTGAPYGGNAVLSLSYDTDQITVNPTALTFTSSDWMNPQTVTVGAIDDSDFESEIGQTHPSTISGSFSGGLYDSIVPGDVTVNITDNEPYCGMPGTPYQTADISGPTGQRDCYVDLYDLAKLAEDWLTNNVP